VVSSEAYGIVVEGAYDRLVYEELIRRISSSDVKVISRDTEGVPKLNRIFPAMLRDFEQVQRGQPVDKALVIRDANGKDPTALEQQMRERIQGQHFSIPKGIQFHAVRRTMETWLLADVSAINSVAAARGGKEVALVQGTLEDIVDPKDRLRRLLSQAGLPYTDQVCREIAAKTSIETLRNRCPSFRIFEQKVIDC
jgi:hypothetical protein